jgi:DNA (cytosine-5)-methyltransferase 1
MGVYYNEYDSFAAEWLRQLIKRGALPAGDVDERPIQDVKSSEIKHYTQCHFFAGIGVWAYALEQAGWGDRPVWTGSCPCQPFSSAGQKAGTSDERHLWPTWFALIRKCRPDTVFGEQVAGKNGRAWFDVVSNDLEAGGYAAGAAATNACSFGAPHRRHRLYFVAALGHANRGRSVEFKGRTRRTSGNSNSTDERLAYADVQRLEGAEFRRRGGVRQQFSDGRMGRPAKRNQIEASRSWDSTAPWDDYTVIQTRDGKAERPIEPGSFPLAYGTPTGMGRVRGYGNGLCAPQAQGFVEAFMEWRP